MEKKWRILAEEEAQRGTDRALSDYEFLHQRNMTGWKWFANSGAPGRSERG